MHVNIIRIRYPRRADVTLAPMGPYQVADAAGRRSQLTSAAHAFSIVNWRLSIGVTIKFRHSGSNLNVPRSTVSLLTVAWFLSRRALGIRPQCCSIAPYAPLKLACYVLFIAITTASRMAPWSRIGLRPPFSLCKRAPSLSLFKNHINLW